MDGGEADRSGRRPTDDPGTPRSRRAGAGQVWIRCALCRRPVELSESVQTPEGRVCPECAVGL
jgi:hypothetical protein